MERSSVESRPRGRLISLIPVVALLVGMLASAGLAQPRVVRANAAAPAAAAFVPADSPLFLALAADPNAPRMAAAQGVLDRLGQGEAFGQLMGQIRLGLLGLLGVNAAGAVQDAELALSVTDFAALTGTQTVIGGGVGVVVILRFPTGADEAFAAIQRALTLDAETRGETITTASYNGTEIVNAGEQTALTLVGDAILIGATATDLHASIDVAAGDAPSLAADPGFGQLAASLPSDPLLFGYIDASLLLPLLRRELAADRGLDLIADRALAPIDGHIAMTVRAETDALLLDLALEPDDNEPAPSPSTGASPRLDREVPDTTTLFFNGTELGASWGMDLVSLLVAQGVVGALGGGSLPFETGAEEPEELFDRARSAFGFNLRDDFALQMTGEYAIALSGASLDPGAIDGVLISGVAEPFRVADAVSKLVLLVSLAVQDNATSGVPPIETRPMDDGLLQVLDVPVDDFGVIHAEAGVVGDRFLLGYRSDPREVLDGPSTPLADDPAYLAAMDRLPTAREWQLYLDLTELGPSIAPLVADALGLEGLDLSAADALVAAGQTIDGVRAMSAVLIVPAPDAEGSAEDA